MKKMYKAVFLDMDGTLLRADHSVSDETKQVIRRLVGEGIPVTLVSARPLNAMLPTFAALGLPAHSPLVSLNGSYIVEAGQPIFQAMIDLPTTAAVAAEVKPFGATIAYYLQREWFAEVCDSWTAHEQKIMDVKVRVGLLPAFIEEWSEKKIGPNKMMVMSEPEAIADIQRHLRAIYDSRLNIYPSKPTYLEVMDPRGSKSNAVRFLIDRMKIGRDEIIAMGDNYNDREMIEFAGMGVAMGNAPDEIKAVADYVTDTNNNDGVRKALERFFG
jgi:Cof subfamily protein (haloacid dehalogenase superfamily)